MQVDEELADELDNHIKESLKLAKELEVPFDQEIAPDNDAGNARVRALVQSLNDVDHTLEDFFERLGLEVQEAG